MGDLAEQRMTMSGKRLVGSLLASGALVTASERWAAWPVSEKQERRSAVHLDVERRPVYVMDLPEPGRFAPGVRREECGSVLQPAMRRLGPPLPTGHRPRTCADVDPHPAAQDPLAVERERHVDVAAYDKASNRLVDDAHARHAPFHGSRLVGGSVVDDEDLVGRAGLSKDGVEARGKMRASL
jgi:hypothetical protein